MARPRKSNPRYLEHKQSGRARAVYWNNAGQYCDVLLPGLFNSPESLGAFGRLLLEQEVAPKGAAIAAKDKKGLSVAEVLSAYLNHATSHYHGSDGKPTSELITIKLVIKSLREMYADLPALEFGPLKLKAVRQGWVIAKLSRAECNRRTRIVRRIFKWAASEELVPAEVSNGLDTVSGLQMGRTIARETAPIEPVEDAAVDATIPFLNRFVVGLVELQRLTGCRPGEACLIRRSEIDTGGKVWLYKPVDHKNKHRGKKRIIAIGPKAQTILKEFFTTDINDYLFPPKLAVEEMHAERTNERKTPKYKSHMARNKNKRSSRPKRAPAECYTAGSYAHAVARACDRAFPPPAPLAQRSAETHAEWTERLTPGQKGELKKWQKEHRWHPNQLRHTFATRVRKQHGLEAAQVLLGHSRADTTQIYAERNESLAARIAEEVG